MTKDLELFLKPLAEDWWERFAAKFCNYQFSKQGVDAGAARQFCGLHFGLRRQQIKLLARYWQQQGRIEIDRNGWRILKLAQPSQMAEVHIK